jgi:hypothetical protein
MNRYSASIFLLIASLSFRPAHSVQAATGRAKRNVAAEPKLVEEPCDNRLTPSDNPNAQDRFNDGL